MIFVAITKKDLSPKVAVLLNHSTNKSFLDIANSKIYMDNYDNLLLMWAEAKPWSDKTIFEQITSHFKSKPM